MCHQSTVQYSQSIKINAHTRGPWELLIPALCFHRQNEGLSSLRLSHGGGPDPPASKRQGLWLWDRLRLKYILAGPASLLLMHYNPARRPAVDMDSEPLPVGSMVLILGLQAKPHLNGVTGTICGMPVAASGRYPVEVGTEKLLLKPQNLERVRVDSDSNIHALSMEDLMGVTPDVSDSTQGNAAIPEVADVSPAAAASTSAAPVTEPLRLRELPTEPMWAPLVDSGSAWRRASKPRGAVPIEEEEEEEDGDEDEPYDDEEEADAQMAADAALLQAAVDGAPSGGGGFAPLDPNEWRTTEAIDSSIGFAPLDPNEWRTTEAIDSGIRTSSNNPANAKTTPQAKCERSERPAERHHHHRFVRELCGGKVLVCDVSTPDGLAAAKDAVAKRVPIHMKGGAPTLLGSLAHKLGSAAAIGQQLGDTEVSVLYAPASVGGRFTYYFDENAYAWNLMAPPPVNRRMTFKWGDALSAS